MVTARGTQLDRVLGLELGADDYIVKPFGFRELVARIRAVRRRSQESAPGNQAAEFPEVSAGPGAWRPYDRSPLQGRGRRGSRPDAQGVRPVGPFGRGPGSCSASHGHLGGIWGPHWYGPTKTVDVHVASLRRKLGHPDWVETVRRVGLRLGDTSGTGTPPEGPELRAPAPQSR